MTTSISFSIAECGILLGGEISHNNDPTLDPTETEWLTDPNAPRDALQRLRILKTRETGEQQQIPNTVGRSNGTNIDLNNLNYTYEELKMRRKATILKHQNKNFTTRRTNYSKIVKGVNMRYSSKARLRQLVESNKCENQPPNVKVAINSGVRNDRTPLYFNVNVPFYSQI